MPRKPSDLTVTDQFCGAGGSSIGATAAGADLRLALNHWKLAIETHNSNFPDAAHDCTDISACNPRRYPSTDILITSPECTNHSLAKGKRKIAQRDLFGNGPDPAEERSRATMWDVPRFAEYHTYQVIVVENVVDARNWVTYDAWLHAMHLLGYEHQAVYFNSMFAHPTPQSRDRMYVVFWRKGHRKPNLVFSPPAYCHACERNVDAVQAWKNGKRFGKYNQQYVYACPHCAGIVQPYYYCAASAIDWGLPIQRIGDRAVPLKEKTLQRIEVGLRKYAQPVAVNLAYGAEGSASPLSDAMRTQTARQTMGMAVPPYLVDTVHAPRNERWQDMVGSAYGSGRTQLGQANQGLVVPPYTLTLRGQNAPKSVTDPVDTVVASGNHHALLVPYYKSGNAGAITDPVPTVTTVDRHALVVAPFLLGYYTRDSGDKAALNAVTEPLPTQSAQPRHYLVEHGGLPAVEDCGFRMLQPHEIKAAMAFPQEYIILGGKREQVKQLGNAVTPPVMGMLMRRIVETFQ